MNDTRAFQTGCRVIYFDSLRQPHEALVTVWWHDAEKGTTEAELQKYYEENMHSPMSLPLCNVVFVSTDTSKEDPYGRQIERATSVTYGRNQGMTPFLGMCWCWPDELEEALGLSRQAIEKRS